jgi:short-subunit dehydrogenase
MGTWSLQGRTALITGASAGMGVEFARQLAAAGVGRLILVARRTERLEALAQELPCDAVAATCDLTDPDAITALLAEYPDVDVLINNAGMGLVGTHDSIGPRASLRMHDLNTRAVLQLVDALLPRMRAQGFGGVLNVGSTAGMVPMPTMALYGATKAWVNSFSDALRSELKGTGVHVSCLAPGPVKTEFFGVASGGAGADPPDFIMMPAAKAVRIALRGLERNRPVVIPGLHMWATMTLSRLSPPWMVRLVTGLYGKMLQDMAGPK